MKRLSLSLSSDLCIHSYWLSRLRQASYRKRIQSSALRLRLRCNKILTCPLLEISRNVSLVEICSNLTSFTIDEFIKDAASLKIRQSSIYYIRWLAGSQGQTTPRLKNLEKIWKKEILGKSDAWSMSRSSHQPIVLYWRLSDFKETFDDNINILCTLGWP